MVTDNGWNYQGPDACTVMNEVQACVQGTGLLEGYREADVGASVFTSPSQSEEVIG